MSRAHGAGLRIESLTKSYGGHAVLDDVSTEVAPGSLTYLLGLNGAGKSTLLRCASGIATPDRGTVEVDGAPWSDRARRSGRVRHLGIHLDHDAFAGETDALVRRLQLMHFTVPETQGSTSASVVRRST